MPFQIECPDRPSRRRRRILFIGEGVSLAHLGRPAVLARWARDAGWNVRLACGNSNLLLGRQQSIEGLTILDLKTITPSRFYERLNKGTFFYTEGEMEDYIQAERHLIRSFKPDLVVGDFRLTLETSTQLEGVPLLSLSQAHWNPVAACPFPPPSRPPFSWMQRTVAKKLFNLIRPLAFRNFAGALDRVRSRFGLDPHGDFRKHYTAGSACAYLDLPFMGDGSSLPKSHFFLGPVPWRPKVASPCPADFSNARPMIYLTCGSSGDSRWVAGVLEGLLACAFDVVITGMNPSLATRLGITQMLNSKHVHTHELIDPGSVLDKACLTICHGGSGTVYQSLSHGVPVCCFPSNPDQWLVSWATERAGLGRVLDSQDKNTGDMGKTILQMTKDAGQRQRVKQVADTMQKWDTYSKWIAYLDSAIPQGASRSLESVAGKLAANI